MKLGRLNHSVTLNLFKGPCARQVGASDGWMLKQVQHDEVEKDRH